MKKSWPPNLKRRANNWRGESEPRAPRLKANHARKDRTGGAARRRTETTVTVRWIVERFRMRPRVRSFRIESTKNMSIPLTDAFTRKPFFFAPRRGARGENQSGPNLGWVNGCEKRWRVVSFCGWIVLRYSDLKKRPVHGPCESPVVSPPKKWPR